MNPSYYRSSYTPGHAGAIVNWELMNLPEYQMVQTLAAQTAEILAPPVGPMITPMTTGGGGAIGPYMDKSELIKTVVVQSTGGAPPSPPIPVASLDVEEMVTYQPPPRPMYVRPGRKKIWDVLTGEVPIKPQIQLPSVTVEHEVSKTTKTWWRKNWPWVAGGAVGLYAARRTGLI